MKNILIIKCGETYPEIKTEYGDFEDWIIARSNLPTSVFKIYNIAEGQILRHPSEYISAIITGSHANVNQRHPWINQLKNWIVTAKYSNIPVLGVCFGHQIIAEALGGSAIQNPNGTMMGTTKIVLNKEGRFDSMFKNAGSSFETYSMHGFIVVKEPLGAKILANNDENSIIEAYRLDKIYGIQFHPEFTPEIMQEYIKIQKVKDSSKYKTKLKAEFKNQSIISNFLDISLKF